jgi:hypothetical protein
MRFLFAFKSQSQRKSLWNRAYVVIKLYITFDIRLKFYPSLSKRS